LGGRRLKETNNFITESEIEYWSQRSGTRLCVFEELGRLFCWRGIKELMIGRHRLAMADAQQSGCW
jgi:hypothetical protein